MSELDFTQAAQSPIYDPAIALEFFKSAGKPEAVPQGTVFFKEDEKSSRLLRETIAALQASGAPTGAGSVKDSRVFDKKLLAQLAHELDEPVRYKRGMVILTEGQAGVFMYVVMEGRVAVSIRGNVVERVGPG